MRTSFSLAEAGCCANNAEDTSNCPASHTPEIAPAHIPRVLTHTLMQLAPCIYDCSHSLWLMTHLLELMRTSKCLMMCYRTSQTFLSKHSDGMQPRFGRVWPARNWQASPAQPETVDRGSEARADRTRVRATRREPRVGRKQPLGEWPKPKANAAAGSLAAGASTRTGTAQPPPAAPPDRTAPGQIRARRLCRRALCGAQHLSRLKCAALQAARLSPD